MTTSAMAKRRTPTASLEAASAKKSRVGSGQSTYSSDGKEANGSWISEANGTCKETKMKWSRLRKEVNEQVISLTLPSEDNALSRKTTGEGASVKTPVSVMKTGVVTRSSLKAELSMKQELTADSCSVEYEEINFVDEEVTVMNSNLILEAGKKQENTRKERSVTKVKLEDKSLVETTKDSSNAADSGKPKEKSEFSENEVSKANTLKITDSRSAKRCSPVKRSATVGTRRDNGDGEEVDAKFIGEPVPEEEAQSKWAYRYLHQTKTPTSEKYSNGNDNLEEIVLARCHYNHAMVDGYVYNLNDDAHVQAGDGEDYYICRIVEFFEGVDRKPYFTAQWFYRCQDTVIKTSYTLEKKRVFFSEIKNDNSLECLVEKLKIAVVPLEIDDEDKIDVLSSCDYFCNMRYFLPYSTFVNVSSDNLMSISEESTISIDEDRNRNNHALSACLLDLYSGCGAMSTGLCLGAHLSGLNLVNSWAVDINKHACESLKHNHPETEVRNESAEDFLALLKYWESLCSTFSLATHHDPENCHVFLFDHVDVDESSDLDDSDVENNQEIFEVEEVLQICYGDPKEKKKCGLYLKVRWRNYGPEYDSWEPIDGLGNCKEAIKDFVIKYHKKKILPLPGEVDVICGGPPCQGISGFNRFRNRHEPLKDEKNKQLIIFMDIVQHLKPNYVLMENVVDIVKFAEGFLGRYALGRLLHMGYQTRMGMMPAGAYGLPQFRMRFFLWGARSTLKLPQFPLPTHDVLVRGVVPVEFESHVVAFEEGCSVELEKKKFLEDAISDLPKIENNEHRDEMPYDRKPQNEFQAFIRLSKDEMLGLTTKSASKSLIYDHRPLELNLDDYQRVCRIPKKKGANFRDLPGVRVRPDNRVEWDPDVERIYLDSGKPLVPDYAMSFVNGASSKPFGRLWWDETVPTVVTRAEPHNQTLVHPEQDRVLSIRENARLQGFPDYYKLFGPIKERYIQVGNAVAVPVARALGYALGMAFQGLAGSAPVFTLPNKFPNCNTNSAEENSQLSLSKID